MQQGSEKMFSPGAHTRASLMGRMLLKFRARVPHQEGPREAGGATHHMKRERTA